MINRSFVRKLSPAIVASIVLGVGIAGMQPSFAGCEVKCKEAKARSMCGAAIKQKGLKGPDAKAEFTKCTADPYNYK